MDPRGNVNPGSPIRLAASQINGLNRLLSPGAGFGDAGAAQPYTATLVADVRLTVPAGISVLPGTALRITGAQRTLPGPSNGVPTTEYLVGETTDIQDYSAGLHGAIGLTIEGTNKVPGASVILPVAISGLAVARVRRFDASHRFAINPVRRISEQAGSQYRGILDSHPCACDSSVRVVSYGSTISSAGDGTGASIVWAVVIV